MLDFDTREESPSLAQQLQKLTSEQQQTYRYKARMEVIHKVSFWIIILLLTILCAGTPDLLDAIIKRVGGY